MGKFLMRFSFFQPFFISLLKGKPNLSLSRNFGFRNFCLKLPCLDGLPADREQYIHRLGRTGRKEKEGQGILLLAPWEEFFLHSIKDLPISKAPKPPLDPETKNKVNRAVSQVEIKNKEAAYQAWLGYYNSNKKIGKEKYKLVELANEFGHSMGLDNPPAIPKLVLGKMGLRNIPALRAK